MPCDKCPKIRPAKLEIMSEMTHPDRTAELGIDAFHFLFLAQEGVLFPLAPVVDPPTLGAGGKVTPVVSLCFASCCHLGAENEAVTAEAVGVGAAVVV